jgi:hypothetical protein
MVQYEIGKMKKLIDLNGQSVNFDINFRVESVDGSEFEMLVLDQTTLDNIQEFNYKKVKGSISGNVLSDKNVYQNHFLILKANKPTNVDVIINKKELPYNQEFVNNQMNNMKQEMQKQTQQDTQQRIESNSSNLPRQIQEQMENDQPKGSSKIFLFIIFIVILLLIYFFVIRKNSSVVGENIITSGLPIPNESLLSRLNNLEF